MKRQPQIGSIYKTHLYPGYLKNSDMPMIRQEVQFDKTRYMDAK